MKRALLFRADGARSRAVVQHNFRFISTAYDWTKLLEIERQGKAAEDRKLAYRRLRDETGEEAVKMVREGEWPGMVEI